jgi:hypothetical protein
MASKVFDHLVTAPTYNRYPNEWTRPESYVSAPKLTAEEAWMQEYEIRLTHVVRYRIAHEHEKPYAEEAAKERLAAHLYNEQRVLAHSALSAVNGGASKREVIGILVNLLESMK